MKKLLIVCVLAIGMMADAQTVQTIAKPLKLNIVTAGSATDSVLVRGADKIVKFVPRSAFGGGGGSQDLQSVLNNGTRIYYPEIPGVNAGGVSGEFLSYDPNFGIYLQLNISDGTGIGGNTYLNKNFYVVGVTSRFKQCDITMDEGVFEINQTGLNGAATKIKFTPPLENQRATLNFPAKTQGNYILATTDDVKLQEYTVATLPTGTKGDVAFVNDAASPSFLATVVGGGSTVVRVFYNGTNWIVQ